MRAYDFMSSVPIFANGAAYAAFSAIIQSGVAAATNNGSGNQTPQQTNANSPQAPTQSQAQLSGMSKVLSVVGDVVGKIWTLPNTIIGGIYGLAGHVAGEIGYALGFYSVSPSIQIGNNAIQFLNNPFTLKNTAITLGNTISYGQGISPSQYGAYEDRSVHIGLHEKAHTYQYQALGPLFLPAYIISGRVSGPAGNPFENAAQNYGRGTGGWWPR